MSETDELPAENSPQVGIDEKENQEIFKLLVDGVRDYAIYMLDVTGHIISWNAGAERAKQYQSKEILGKHFSVFYTPEDRANGKPQRLLNQSKKEGRVEDVGWRVRKDGTRFWADVILTPLYDSTGKHRGFAKVTRDLTERRILMEAKEDADRASQAKSAFLANMSHELRTPLTGIIGYAEMVLENVHDLAVDEVAEDVGKILYSANHLKSVVSDILDVSRIEAGQLELKDEHVELDQLIREVVEGIEPLAMCTHTRLEIATGEPGICLLIDRTRLRQVLYNLLSNAAKFTHDGVIRVKTSINNSQKPAEVSIEVTDTGVGMTESEAASIFDRFYRSEAHISKYNQGGTGLGLAICRMLCEAMGGKIEVMSEVGKGSTFVVVLPVIRPERPSTLANTDFLFPSAPEDDDF